MGASDISVSNESANSADDLTTIAAQIESQVTKAIHTIVEYSKNETRPTKSLLDEADNSLHLQFAFKRVPSTRNKKIYLNLPHSVRSEVTDVCLLIKDESKDRKEDYELTARRYKRFLSQNGVKNIAEVMTLRQLRLEYKPYEAKRKLCHMFDVFLADSRIIKFLPTVLGKEFWKTKKFPVQVNLRAKNLSEELNSKIHLVACTLTGGSCSTIHVGNSKQTERCMVQNVMAALHTLAEKIPGGWQNVRCAYLKMPASPSLPIYQSTGSANEVILAQPKRQRYEPDEPEEITTVPEGKVQVTRGGWVRVVNDNENWSVTSQKNAAKSKHNHTVESKKNKASQKTMPEVDVNAPNTPTTAVPSTNERAKRKNSKQSRYFAEQAMPSMTIGGKRSRLGAPVEHSKDNGAHKPTDTRNPAGKKPRKKNLLSKKAGQNL